MEKLGIGTKIDHPSFGMGVVVEINGEYYKIYFTKLNEVKEIDREFEGMTVTDKVMPDFQPIEIVEIEKALEKVLLKYSNNNHIVPLANKWMGGTVTINAGSDDMQCKEIPIRTFFNKIIMVRDRLRVLEQSINSHKVLSEEEKIHMQQYITRAYGSLTTFNVLFDQKEDSFKGAGK
jgi:hypothetical protein